jgi:TetR/AcrR family transcriptional regulator, regulator of autoinduction and epiphytic fitness
MEPKAPTPRKRRHVERPDIRCNLIDAAEAIILEQGYAAATARAVANRAGLKHQAVFYYFGSQDDLLMAVLQRSIAMQRERLDAALGSEHPMSAMWNALRDPSAMRLTLEFMALANHNDAIRAEIASNADAVRSLEAGAITNYLAGRGIQPLLSPETVSILTNAVARLLVQEATLGIDRGHRGIIALADRSFQAFEASGDAAAALAAMISANSPDGAP